MGKIVVTGTGRCGTSFLMHLFTRIGLNTGYSIHEADDAMNKIEGLNAGIEHSLGMERTEKADIIKNPEWIKVDKFKELQEAYDIDHVIIPIRDLEATAKSREYMHNNTHGNYGGFWGGADDLESQKNVNAKLFYSFIEYLSAECIDFTLINFEPMMRDKFYLSAALPIIHPFLEEFMDDDTFCSQYDELLDSEKIRF